MDNASTRAQLKTLLHDLEYQLRQTSLWQLQPLSEEQLTSDQPFAADHLTLPQWLQFVFIPRLRNLLSSNVDLPKRCAIAPMAEVYFKHCGVEACDLIKSLLRIDEILNQP